MPYNRYLSAVLGFVGDVVKYPYLSIFRRFLPMVRVGPGVLDLSPMGARSRRWWSAASFRRVRGSAPAPLRRCGSAAGATAAVHRPARPGLEADRRQLDRRGESVDVFFGSSSPIPCNPASCWLLEGNDVRRGVLIAVALGALAVYFTLHASGRCCGAGGLLLEGALGNLIDRAREGAVIDFIDPVAWPAFNVADAAIVIGVLALLYVAEARPRDALPSARLATRACAWTPCSRPTGRRRPAPRRREAARRRAVTVDGRAGAKSHRVAEGESV